ncbi:prolyl-tRNA synthetase, partial [Candidatus Parcubacteria bacterium]|nr:prolyl-tRNA synthetase [Candidatus Parcubacteria bacterium]
MKQSKLFTKTRKSISADETSKNAQLLIRAGFVHKEMAGVYTFLPLGLRVIEKIKDIIREELNNIGAFELKMTTLQQKDIWEKTDRWDEKKVDDWFRTNLKNGAELGLAFTHEEPLTNIMKNYILSYKDLPVYAYQFQTKFRNELRAKSGIMRGREFIMKDLYDFSLNKEEHDKFYEKMKSVYMKIFNRVGIGDKTYLTMSSGGSFSKYSFEFQTISNAGEDVILYDKDKKIAINKDDYSEEIFIDFNLKKEELKFREAKSIEVGDIYTLGEKYSKALGLTYKDKKGRERVVYMGSYGIGIPRLMGTVVEIFNDEKGI